MKKEERREQIISTTINLLSRHGLPGTTVARIAQEVGISEPALYRHFNNKRDIILASLESVSAKLLELLYSAGEAGSDLLDRLYRMSKALYDFVMNHPEETVVLFEVLSASRDQELKKALQKRFLEFLGIIEALLKEGVEEGVLREDLDVSLTSWMILSLGITLNFASLLELKDVLTEEKALIAVERILKDIAREKLERKER